MLDNDATQLADELDAHAITRRAVWSQMLWIAGYSLTTGPFLSYFGQDLGAKGTQTALLLILPETAGLMGIFTRGAVRRFRGRKRVWIVFSLVARVASLGIPLAAFPAVLPFSSTSTAGPLWLMMGSLAFSQAAGAIAYVAYLAWMADAVPANRWGRFFAARNIGELSVLLVVPVLAGYSRDWWKSHARPDHLLVAYAVAYFVGVVLLLASMLPLLKIPEREASPEELHVGNLARIREAFADRSLRFLLFHNWWLAIANGITQAAIFGYLYGPLKVGLGTTYVLNDVMRAVGIPVSWVSGRIADRRGNKPLMIAGVLVAGCSMIFWLLATPGRWWWLFGAYACWGAFPAVNITGQNLVFKLAPAQDKTASMALFRQIGGLLAGLSGLAGGIWLDRLVQSDFGVSVGPFRLAGFQILFFVSLIGRLTAAVWLLPVREPASVVHQPARTLNTPGESLVSRASD